MRISIVLPLLDGMPHLPEVLASIVAQTLPPVEILVTDGGSTDGSLEACAAVSLVRVINGPGVSLSGRYNAGVEAARGELIAFAADDDPFLPEKLERQVEALADGADGSLCLAEAFLDGPPPPGFRSELLAGPRVMRLPETLLLRREAWDRVGGFRDEAEPAGDLDWFNRAGEAGLRFAVAEGGVLLRKRYHGGSITHGSPAMHPAILSSLRDAIERRRT